MRLPSPKAAARPPRAARVGTPRVDRRIGNICEDGSRGRQYAENVCVAELLALRSRAADRDRGCCANRAPDLRVNATAPDRGGAENAQLDPQGLSAKGR